MPYNTTPTGLLERYDTRRLMIAALASHSALDVFDGAKDEGFTTLAVCERGREKPYLRFNRVVDEAIILEKFSDIAKGEVVSHLRSKNAIFIPNRSFTVYVGYQAIENTFAVPVFGNRRLLRYEERVGDKNYYKLLDQAQIRRPKTYKTPDDIDRPVMVKLPHAKRRAERGFFIAFDREDFYRKLRDLTAKALIREEDVANASIEELVVGAHFNVNYFHSVARRRVELLSIDRRLQTNLDGFLRLPADAQLELRKILEVEMTEIGHEMATIRESMLEKLFEVGDRFVEATKAVEPPGVIGPFTLQLVVTEDMEIAVFDVALRIGGGTNVFMGIGSQYSKLYFGGPISMGRRIALEVRECAEQGRLEEVVT